MLRADFGQQEATPPFIVAWHPGYYKLDTRGYIYLKSVGRRADESHIFRRVSPWTGTRLQVGQSYLDRDELAGTVGVDVRIRSPDVWTVNLYSAVHIQSLVDEASYGGYSLGFGFGANGAKTGMSGLSGFAFDRREGAGLVYRAFLYRLRMLYTFGDHVGLEADGALNIMQLWDGEANEVRYSPFTGGLILALGPIHVAGRATYLGFGNPADRYRLSASLEAHF